MSRPIDLIDRLERSVRAYGRADLRLKKSFDPERYPVQVFVQRLDRRSKIHRLVAEARMDVLRAMLP